MSNTKSNADRIREYFHRQYELEEGSPEENVYDLFARDAEYHLGEGKTLSPEAVAGAAAVIRQTPKNERITTVSDFSEEGDLVTFHMHFRYRNPETGELEELESDHEWRFNADGKVAEVNMNRGAEAERVFRVGAAAAR